MNPLMKWWFNVSDWNNLYAVSQSDLFSSNLHALCFSRSGYCFRFDINQGAASATIIVICLLELVLWKIFLFILLQLFLVVLCFRFFFCPYQINLHNEIKSNSIHFMDIFLRQKTKKMQRWGYESKYVINVADHSRDLCVLLYCWLVSCTCSWWVLQLAWPEQCGHWPGG